MVCILWEELYFLHVSPVVDEKPSQTVCFSLNQRRSHAEMVKVACNYLCCLHNKFNKTVSLGALWKEVSVEVKVNFLVFRPLLSLPAFHGFLYLLAPSSF